MQDFSAAALLAFWAGECIAGDHPVHCMFLFYFIYFYFYLRQSLTLLPSLEYGVTILDHCKLHLLGSRDSHASASQVAGITGVCHHAWLMFVFLVETGFRHVGQAGLKLLASGDLSTSAFQSAGITSMSHRAWPTLGVFLFLFLFFSTIP